MALAIKVKLGEKVRIILPDGREGWATWLPLRGDGARKLIFSLPTDVKILREGLELQECGHADAK